MRIASRIAGRIDAVIDAIGGATAWFTFALVLVMSGNVLLRYLFHAGSVWSQELEWHLMAPICLFGMSYALRHGEHVRVDVLFARLSQRQKTAVDLVSAVLAVVVCLIVIDLSLAYVAQSYRVDEGSANPGGIPGRYALKALIPLGFLLLALQSVAQAIRAYLTLARRD